MDITLFLLVSYVPSRFNKLMEGIVATTQFRGRTFDCPADSGANLAQCDGNNVLSGLRIDNGTNVGAYFGGLLGLVAVLYTLSCFVLWVSSSSRIQSDADD